METLLSSEVFAVFYQMRLSRQQYGLFFTYSFTFVCIYSYTYTPSSDVHINARLVCIVILYIRGYYTVEFSDRGKYLGDLFVEIVKGFIMCVGTDNRMCVTKFSKFDHLKIELLELLESAS
jgi:hypothetical protein